jgi:hypothetical protein
MTSPVENLSRGRDRPRRAARQPRSDGSDVAIPRSLPREFSFRRLRGHIPTV